MLQIHFATTNKGKVDSAQSILGTYGIEVIHVDLELPEPRSYDLQEIASHKARAAYQRIQKPVITLDAGFYIHSLNGFPRSFVNFVLETIKLEGILKLVEKKPRACEFKSCLAYYDDGLEDPIIFESVTRGILSSSPRGIAREYQWSILYFIFIPEGENKTLAEMSPQEYQKWRKERDDDHYAIKFAEWFIKRKTAP